MDSSFIAYPSISNFDKVANTLTQFMNILVVAEHKIDGSNFQIIFEYDEKNVLNVKYACRNLVLVKDTKNFSFEASVRDQEGVIERIKSYILADKNITQLNLYGELYGCLRCANRVKYFDPTPPHDKLKFFEIKINGTSLTVEKFYNLCEQLDIPKVECIGVMELREALKIDLYDPNLISRLTQGSKYIEGIVIKCFDKPLFAPVKIKTREFCEYERRKDVTSPNKEPSVSATLVYEQQLRDYVTENRIINVLRKQPYSKKDIPLLCTHVIEDALKDFHEYNENARENITMKNCVFKEAKQQVFLLIKKSKLVQDLLDPIVPTE